MLRNVFNLKEIQLFAERIKSNYNDFESEKFLEFISKKFEDLQFNERMIRIADALTLYLPKNFLDALKILNASLGSQLEENKLNGYSGFIIMSCNKFVTDNGMSEEYLHHSLNSMYLQTKCFSSEFGIRHFFIKFPNQTLEYFHKWAEDENLHVRRLVSEGSRPKLPLSFPLKQFVKDPFPVIELLEKLKFDPELYVRRSVANNLNDISKDNPDIVVKTLLTWRNQAIESKNEEIIENTEWMIKHALRTLIKKGNKSALGIMGAEKNANISNLELELSTDSIQIGNNMKILVNFDSLENQKLVVDYKIHFVKSNKSRSEKVFKMRVAEYKVNEKVKIQSTQSFRQFTTRTHYPGTHTIELLFNGESLLKKDFEVYE